MVTSLPERKGSTPVGVEVLQVRAALIGLLLSVITTTVIPLFAVIFIVIMFVVYTNGHVEDTPAGGTS
jgi:hypothetical protein